MTCISEMKSNNPLETSVVWVYVTFDENDIPSSGGYGILRNEEDNNIEVEEIEFT